MNLNEKINIINEKIKFSPQSKIFKISSDNIIWNLKNEDYDIDEIFESKKINFIKIDNNKYILSKEKVKKYFYYSKSIDDIIFVYQIKFILSNEIVSYSFFSLKNLSNYEIKELIEEFYNYYQN